MFKTKSKCKKIIYLHILNSNLLNSNKKKYIICVAEPVLFMIKRYVSFYKMMHIFVMFINKD